MALYDNWNWDSGNKILTMVADDVKGYDEEHAFGFEDVQDWIDDFTTPPDIDHTESCNTTQFCIGYKIVIGNGSTPTWFVDTSRQVTFKSGLGTCMEAKAYSHIRFGELVDEATKSVRYGCDFLVESVYGNTEFLKASASDSSCEIYGGVIRGYDTAYHSTYLKVGTASWQGKIYHVLFDRVWIYPGSYADVYQINFFKTQRPSLSITSGEQDQISFFDCSCPIYISSISGITVSNIIARGATTLAALYYAYGNTYLINVDSDVWTFIFDHSPNAVVYRQYTFDLKVVDKDGTTISGATVTLYDKNGNQVFQVTTAANGTITQQTVSRGYYNQANGDTLQDYSPHRLTVTKSGYHDVEVEGITLDKIDWQLEMEDNIAPVAAFTFSPTNPVPNETTVSFNASESHDPDGTISSYSWNFGDGNSGSGQTTSHKYTGAGNYAVVLTVTDDDGDTDTFTQTINVAQPKFLLGVKERTLPIYHFRDTLHVTCTVKPQQHPYRKVLQVIATVNPDQRLLKDTLRVECTVAPYKRFHDTLKVKCTINPLVKTF